MPSFVKGLKIGRELKSARVARRLSVQELAQLAGLSPYTLYRLEWGHSQPSLTTLKALDEVFGLGWDHFGLGWDDPNGGKA